MGGPENPLVLLNLLINLSILRVLLLAGTGTVSPCAPKTTHIIRDAQALHALPLQSTSLSSQH